jgi:2-polyprenyl-3-methyl-5-hydroxy-6-metoxy-1,4-benzoquinol methylase
MKEIKIIIGILLFHVGLLPSRYKKIVKTILLTKKFDNQYFLNRNLKWAEKGYWEITPMPTEENLNNYYSSTYWDRRGDNTNTLINERDVSHFNMIRKAIPDLFNNKNLRILNFGAGHGGISHLFHAAGYNIVNIEPNDIKQYYDDHWLTHTNLNDCEGQFDLIYGSHSLEHVQNLDIFLNKIKSISHDNTYIFMEVPNSRNDLNINKPIIRPPHTYYFTKSYFETISDHVVVIETYSKNKLMDNEDGNVIRFLCKGLL